MDKDAREMMLQAEGMTCSGCAEDMETVLRNTEGILDAKVNFADETIKVRYGPRHLDRDQVYAAVKNLGYKVTIVSET